MRESGAYGTFLNEKAYIITLLRAEYETVMT